MHLLASLESNLWGVLARRNRSGDEAATTACSPATGSPGDLQNTITRALYATLVIGVVGGVLLVAAGATLVGAILLSLALVTAVGIYRQYRFARLSR